MLPADNNFRFVEGGIAVGFGLMVAGGAAFKARKREKLQGGRDLQSRRLWVMAPLEGIEIGHSLHDMFRMESVLKSLPAEKRMAAEGKFYAKAFGIQIGIFAAGKFLSTPWNNHANKKHLAPNRKAQIQGLQHSGVMAARRKVETDFGSPWQGSAMSGEIAAALARGEYVNDLGQTPTTLNQIEDIFGKFSSAKPKYIASGKEHMVFDLGDKVGRVGYGKATAIPDLPEVLKPLAAIDVGRHHVYVMPKVTTAGVAPEMVENMTKTLAAKGWRWDAHAGNLGFQEGKALIIDHGAMRKLVQTAQAETTQVMRAGEGSAIVSGLARAVRAIGSRVMRGV
jgi:hypothetical protein